LYNSYGHLTNFIAIGIYIRSSFCKNSLIPYDNYLDKHRNMTITVSATGGGRIIAYSAGSEPAEEINPLAVKVMQEIGINISGKKPKPIENYINKPFDLVIMECYNKSGVLKRKVE